MVPHLDVSALTVPLAAAQTMFNENHHWNFRYLLGATALVTQTCILQEVGAACAHAAGTDTISAMMSPDMRMVFRGLRGEERFPAFRVLQAIEKRQKALDLALRITPEFLYFVEAKKMFNALSFPPQMKPLRAHRGTIDIHAKVAAVHNTVVLDTLRRERAELLAEKKENFKRTEQCMALDEFVGSKERLYTAFLIKPLEEFILSSERGAAASSRLDGLLNEELVITSESSFAAAAQRIVANFIVLAEWLSRTDPDSIPARGLSSWVSASKESPEKAAAWVSSCFTGRLTAEHAALLDGRVGPQCRSEPHPFLQSLSAARNEFHRQCERLGHPHFIPLMNAKYQSGELDVVVFECLTQQVVLIVECKDNPADFVKAEEQCGRLLRSLESFGLLQSGPHHSPAKEVSHGLCAEQTPAKLKTQGTIFCRGSEIQLIDARDALRELDGVGLGEVEAASSIVFWHPTHLAEVPVRFARVDGNIRWGLFAAQKSEGAPKTTREEFRSDLLSPQRCTPQVAPKSFSFPAASFRFFVEEPFLVFCFGSTLRANVSSGKLPIASSVQHILKRGAASVVGLRAFEQWRVSHEPSEEYSPQWVTQLLEKASAGKKKAKGAEWPSQMFYEWWAPAFESVDSPETFDELMTQPLRLALSEERTRRSLPAPSEVFPLLRRGDAANTRDVFLW
jgi:hypothetical protein